jgi:hypothetical protein
MGGGKFGLTIGRPDAHPMAKEGDGYRYADIAAAAIGNE